MPASRLRGALAALVAAGALTACTSTEEALIARGTAPTYAAGYHDGCASGNAAGGSLFSDGRHRDSETGGP
jgi:hypothetical protein